MDKFADIFYQNENQSAGDLGKLQGQLRPAIDRYEVLEVEKQDIFKSTLASFNRVYAYITQVCRLFDKDIHRFSIYSKFLYTMLPNHQISTGMEFVPLEYSVIMVCLYRSMFHWR